MTERIRYTESFWAELSSTMEAITAILIYSITGSLRENRNLSPVTSVRLQWFGIAATIFKIKDKTLELIHYIRPGTRKRLQSSLLGNSKEIPKGTLRSTTNV